MVHDQGEVIDSIEANVESTQVRVQEGTEQLRQAETYKVRFRTNFKNIYQAPSTNALWFVIFNLITRYADCVVVLPTSFPSPLAGCMSP